MADEYRDIYETHRVELVRNLRIHRTFLFDYLRSKKVLDKDDCELIQAEKTSERQAGKLLDLLCNKGENGFDCFTEALQLQSPELYEIITGKNAGTTPNPILRRCRLGTGYQVEAVEIELLTEHLSRSYAELQSITTQYNSLAKEKRELEGRLMMKEIDIEREKSHVTAWEDKFYQEKTFSLKKQDEAKKFMKNMACENKQKMKTIKSLEKETTQLKMSLLYSRQQEIEFKEKLKNANAKKNKEIRYRQEIGENYEKERKQAQRLSVQLKYQDDELQLLDVYKRRCGELQLGVTELEVEKKKIQEELEELTKWTNKLKNRYDTMEKDNILSKEKNQTVQKNITDLQNEIHELKKKSSSLEIENEFLKFRVTFLEKDCEVYKRQRDNAIISRNETVEERNKLWQEKEGAWQHYIVMQKARDDEIKKRELCMKDMELVEDRFNETVSQLAKCKLKLNETELLLEEIRNKEKVTNKQNEIVSEELFDSQDDEIETGWKRDSLTTFDIYISNFDDLEEDWDHNISSSKIRTWNSYPKLDDEETNKDKKRNSVKKYCRQCTTTSSMQGVNSTQADLPNSGQRKNEYSEDDESLCKMKKWNSCSRINENYGREAMKDNKITSDVTPFEPNHSQDGRFICYDCHHCYDDDRLRERQATMKKKQLRRQAHVVKVKKGKRCCGKEEIDE